MIYHGTIELVDDRDRTVATIALCGKDPEHELRGAIERWRDYGVVGGYARDEDGRMLTYA